MKLTKRQRREANEARDTYARAVLEGKPVGVIDAIEHAIIAATEVERERMADKLASIIGMWPHGLDELEALEARCRRCEA